MINNKEIEKYDSCKMYETYNMWPELARDAFENQYNANKVDDITHIVFAGMGGSGAIGDIFNAILSKTNIHVSVVKGYLLPRTVNKNTLVVTTSISGNTVETLNILKKSIEIGCMNIAISSGGKMEKICLQNKISFNKIKMNHSPRSSFASFVYSTLKILQPIIPIKTSEIMQSIRIMEQTRQEIADHNLTESNPALSLAKWIQGVPLIYYPHGLQAAAIRFKNSLQENSKNHAIIEDVIEASHNGVVGWETSSIVKPILIQGDQDYIKTKERWKILKEYFDHKSIDYKEVFAVKGDIFTKLMNLIYLFDYASIYRAVDTKIDPSLVSPIDFIKARLET